MEKKIRECLEQVLEQTKWKTWNRWAFAAQLSALLMQRFGLTSGRRVCAAIEAHATFDERTFIVHVPMDILIESVSKSLRDRVAA